MTGASMDSPHRSKSLAVSDNTQMRCLLPYSQEFNPIEILWHDLREKLCSNRVFDTLEAVVDQVKKELANFLMERDFVYRLSGWPWSINSIL